MSKVTTTQIEKTGGVALTLPTADGTNGQSLQTNGSAVLSFGDNTDATKLPLAGGTLTGGLTGTSATWTGALAGTTATWTGALIGVASTWSGTLTLADNILTTPIIKDYSETVYAGGNTSTAVTLAETNGNVQTWTMTGNCTFTMPSAAGLQAGTSLTLILTQDGTGSRTGVFTGVKWAGGTAPTLTTTLTTGVDIITFHTFNGGASPVWYGFAAGMDMS